MDSPSIVWGADKSYSGTKNINVSNIKEGDTFEIYADTDSSSYNSFVTSKSRHEIAIINTDTPAISSMKTSVSNITTDSVMFNGSYYVPSKTSVSDV